MTLAVIGLQIVLIIPIQIAATIFAHTQGGDARSIIEHPAMLAVVNIIALGAVIYWGVHRNPVPWQQVLPLRAIPWRVVLAIAVMVPGMGILLSEIDNLFRRVVPVPDFVAELFKDLLHNPAHLWAAAVTMILVAPATEEPLFRGVILRGLLGHCRTGTAIVASSLLFGLAHLNPWQFISATLLGMVFAWWYVRTQSLLPGLIGHALANGLVFCAPYFPFEIRGFNRLSDYQTLELQPVWFDGLGLALVLLGAWLFRRWTPKSSGEESAPPVIDAWPASPVGTSDVPGQPSSSE